MPRKVSEPFLLDKYRVTLKELAEYLNCSITKVRKVMAKLGIKGQRVVMPHGYKKLELNTTAAQRIINDVRRWRNDC